MSDLMNERKLPPAGAAGIVKKETIRMSTLTGSKTTGMPTLLHSNPILSRLSKAEKHVEGDIATYGGIAAKTTFFLALTLIGMIAQLLVRSALINEPIWQTFTFRETFTVSITFTEAIILAAVVLGGFLAELVGIFARRTIPVTGSLYALSQGYLISFLVFKVLKGYEFLGLEALVITVAVIAVMSWLYSSGIIKVNGTFRTVLLSLLLGSIAFGVFTFIGSLIPAIQPYVQSMMQNPALAIGIDVLGIVIASLLLISDFAVIDTCVKEGYSKKYEWAAAFGLVFTVLWLYLKILNLLIQVSGKSKK